MTTDKKKNNQKYQRQSTNWETTKKRIKNNKDKKNNKTIKNNK